MKAPCPPLSSSEDDCTKDMMQQSIRGDRNQTVGNVLGGLIVYGNVTITNSETLESLVDKAPRTLDQNPYKGLLAFHESDKDFYFGRSEEIQILWNRFRDLHKEDGATRLLPIYGPSGSGKSSLARAGLLPELGDNPIPGRDRARVAVMVPGTSPLHNLAAVLARIAENDLTPVSKTREFTKELSIASRENRFDGLQRIASLLPDISTFPLIVLIDQFEEVYSLCKDVDEQNQFIDNLLYAANDCSQYVSIILTFRSDFLGETHRHSELNSLFSSQGFLAPMLDEDDLREAIVQPAEGAGYAITPAVVDRLIQEIEGREGTLPLLQVALSRIWQNLPEKEPAQTLREIDGVSGALVDTAERLYLSLSKAQQAVAKRIFLGLVQLGEGVRDTRRRVSINNLLAAHESSEEIQGVLRKLSSPSSRLITLSNEGDIKTAEVTHEALLIRWPRLRDWINNSRKDLRFQRQLEEATKHWNELDRSKGSLWRFGDLVLLEDFVGRTSNDPALQLTVLQTEFYRASQQQRDEEKQAEQERIETQKRLIESEEKRIKSEKRNTKIKKNLERKRLEEEKKRLELEKRNTKITRNLSRVVIVAACAFCSVVAISSMDSAEQRQTIENVFLGDNTREILESLPKLEASANKLRKNLDILPEPFFLGSAVEIYRKDEGEFKKLFAYYRNILEILNRLKLDNPELYAQAQVEQSKSVEAKLTELLIKYRIPQLQLELDNKKFGTFLEKPPSAREHQYSDGAMKTTYEILMTSAGAGADLNQNGDIENPHEASHLPCPLLEKVEQLWRKATDDACGWYAFYDDPYSYDSDCKQLDEDKSTLYTTVFDYANHYPLDRLKECKIQPK